MCVLENDESPMCHSTVNFLSFVLVVRWMATRRFGASAEGAKVPATTCPRTPTHIGVVSGSVYLVRHTATQSMRVMKKIYIRSSPSQAKNEANILSQVSVCEV
jgi:hypothetical protein